MSADNTIAAELIQAMREIIRRAVLTLVAVRDPDKRYLGMARLPQTVVHDVNQAYGYVSASLRFVPSSYEIDQMEIVLPWLAWLRHGLKDDRSCRRILGWSMGVPVYKLAQREDCSERTILNRIDRSICEIIQQFVGVGVEVEHIDEPYKSTPYALVMAKPDGPHGVAKIQRVYIGGVGFMKGSRRIRRGDEALNLPHPL
jgi:uncharacterized protein DUF6362